MIFNKVILKINLAHQQTDDMIQQISNITANIHSKDNIIFQYARLHQYSYIFQFWSKLRSLDF